ncbi:MAG TPA: GTPase HflX [Candidatus Hydrogenedens sp.]|nr:GTPase HflX [Candidatus Hydrogenedens sp.]
MYILIVGNIHGLKANQIKRLESLKNRKPVPTRIISVELSRTLCEISHEIERQIGILIDRRGRITHICVGNAQSIPMVDIERRALNRLSEVRLVHTHLRTNSGLDNEDLSYLAIYRLDAVAAIEVDENALPRKIHYAHLLPANEENEPWQIYPPTTIHELKDDFLELIGSLEEELERNRTFNKPNLKGDNAILIHVSTQPISTIEDSIQELMELSQSAGIKVLDKIIQRRPPDPKYVMGQGKLKYILIRAVQLGADMLVFDQNLTPSQVKSLSDFTDLKILDRTQVILDIFAQHAITREGKIQVELAQLKYLFPFLGIKQTALSRLTGGIGGRGPGETKLEIDRRRARDRIALLEREVKELGKRRELRRQVRTVRRVPTVAIVGYTNAGKSTLLNNLTNSSVVAEDFLFATLHPVSRRLRFPREREVVVIDTVGFIRNLPKDLMSAFRTTFEEINDADLLIHVLDVSSEDVEEKHDTVIKLLKDLELDSKPRINVLNKIDKANPNIVQGLIQQYEGVPVCALDPSTFAPLLERMEMLIWGRPVLHESKI